MWDNSRSSRIRRVVGSAIRCAVVLALLMSASRSALAAPSEYEMIPCPPSFPSVYRGYNPVNHDLGINYRGTSKVTDTKLEYSFRGTNANFYVRGIHHLTADQCVSAWEQWLLGIPAIIMNLHQASYGVTTEASPTDGGCYDGGGDGGDGGDDGGEDPMAKRSLVDIATSSRWGRGSPAERAAPAAPAANASCGGGGGGYFSWTDVPGVECHEQYIVIEASLDGGAHWFVYWEGWGEVCDMAM
jgi:hypothetical protein